MAPVNNQHASAAGTVNHENDPAVKVMHSCTPTRHGEDVELDSAEDGEQYQTVLSAKQIKNLAKPEFAANPDKFYPTQTLRRLSYDRHTCACGHNYWRRTAARTTCGDSNCEQKYTFIGKGTGIGRDTAEKKGTKISYGDAWQGFKRSLTSARIPCTAIQRYPVVARWRADVDFVAAGIFCFQPYCVTGEMSPPANPLICPQFCLRFNDLDNIGLTGRHYSGFVMLGIQVFNLPNDRKFWSDECVEFNYDWLTKELGIDPDEITFIEDVWAGGGNLGPSIEYFVGGLELGNMVFMQYKTFPDGSREPLQVQVIDTGIGLERIPWLINGSPTSYLDVFPHAFKWINQYINLDVNSDIWQKFGPLSCLLNVDEVEDLDATWAKIAAAIGHSSVKQVRDAIEPVKDLYTVLDHTRTSLMAIVDGALPSNVGGGSNIRNLIRRTFSILVSRGWFDKIGGLQGILELYKQHRTDLAALYGEFREYSSFDSIITLEYNRWTTTDDKQKQLLTALLKKRKNKLTIDDWIMCVTSYGLPAELVAKESKSDIPGNLWYEIATRQETTVKVQPTQLYNTAHIPETDCIYYHHDSNYKDLEFDGKILAILPYQSAQTQNSNSVVQQKQYSVLALDTTAFYPTSGGQEHDVGTLTIDKAEYAVVDCIKVGPAVLHIIQPQLPQPADQYLHKPVHGVVDRERRATLRNHHTATHIVFAACRRVLGPHIWQNGAKKTVHGAHLDITHYGSLTFDDVQKIESEANNIVMSSIQINKSYRAKDDAEQQHGFSLYQGGVVPGNVLRVVNIVDTDTEACCGTHADNTAEVGLIKIIKAARISDGIVRLNFVASRKALDQIRADQSILHSLESQWKISKREIVQTGERFFKEAKVYKEDADTYAHQIISLQVKTITLDSSIAKYAIIRSRMENPTILISDMPAQAEKLKSTNKGVVYISEKFIYGLMGSAELFDPQTLKAEIDALQAGGEQKEEEKSAPVASKPVKLVVKNQVSINSKDKSGKKVSKKVDGIVEFIAFLPDTFTQHKSLYDWFTTTHKFVEVD